MGTASTFQAGVHRFVLVSFLLQRRNGRLGVGSKNHFIPTVERVKWKDPPLIGFSRYYPRTSRLTTTMFNA
jgi:hypothetical protein